MHSPREHSERRRTLVRRTLTGVVAIAVALQLLPAGAGSPSTLAEVTDAVGATAAHGAGFTGDGVDVAVIDTGVEPVPGLDGHGKLVIGPDLSFEAGVPELYGRDTYGHGTVMASIIAGSDGPDGFQGVAPGARVVSLKVADNTGAVDVSQVIAALEWITAHGRDNGLNIRVINLSYVTDGTQPYLIDPLAHAVERAWHAGYVVVVAAGNAGNDTLQLGNPAADPYVIAVAAASDVDAADFSNKGSDTRRPDIMAPGDRVLGLAAPTSRLAQENPGAIIDGRYLRGSGTSQATAIVSGTAALLLEQRPDLTPDQVKALLVTGAVDQDGTGQAGEFDALKPNAKFFDLLDQELELRAEAAAYLEEAAQFDLLGDVDEATHAREQAAKLEEEADKARIDAVSIIVPEYEKVLARIEDLQDESAEADELAAKRRVEAANIRADAADRLDEASAIRQRATATFEEAMAHRSEADAQRALSVEPLAEAASLELQGEVPSAKSALLYDLAKLVSAESKRLEAEAEALLSAAKATSGSEQQALNDEADALDELSRTLAAEAKDLDARGDAAKGEAKQYKEAAGTYKDEAHAYLAEAAAQDLLALDLEAAAASIESDAVKAEGEAADLEADAQTIDADAAALEARSRDALVEARALELEALEAERVAAETRFESKLVYPQQLLRAAERRRAAAVDAREQADLLRSDAAEVRATADAERSTAAELRTEAVDVRAGTAVAIAEADDLRAAAETLSVAADAHKAESKELEAEAAGFLEAATAVLAEFTFDGGTTTADLIAQVEAQEAMARPLLTAAEELKAEAKRLDAEAEALLADATALEAGIGEIEAEADALDDEAGRADDRARHLELEAGELESDADKLDEEAETLDAAANLLDVEAAEVEASLQAQLDSVLSDWSGAGLGEIAYHAHRGAGIVNIERSLGLPTLDVAQAHARSTGTGSLEAARGSSHVILPDGSLLEGEVTFTGSSWSGSSWSGSSWSGSSWSGSSWSGSSWSGSSWSGSSWSGSSWG